MNKYAVGDKFIIEIEGISDTPWGGESSRLYRIKGFNTLVFDENGLDRLERKKKDDLRIGDEVTTPAGTRCVVLHICASGDVDTLTAYGAVMTYSKVSLKQTGNTYPVGEWLRKLNKDEDEEEIAF